MGCAEGVWIGFRHDPKCKFGIFIDLDLTDSRNSYAASSTS